MTICPYCRTEIGAEQAAVTCTRCGLPYHRECWHENGGCATYGCRGGATAGPAGPVTTGHPLDVDLGPEPAWERPRPPVPLGQPWPRPLFGVLCEAFAVLGAVFGAVVGGVEGAKSGSLGLVIGLAVGLVLGTVGGAIALPLGVLALGGWAASSISDQHWNLLWALVPVAACVAVFALLLRTRVNSWPPILR